MAEILVVDDSKTMRRIVIRTLRQAGYGGHNIREAQNGQEAIGIVAGSKPDLILSDWNMPEMLGIDLLKAVRASGNHVPFFFVTSEQTKEMRDLAGSEGANGVISKPFSVEVFQEALAAVPVLKG